MHLESSICSVLIFFDLFDSVSASMRKHIALRTYVVALRSRVLPACAMCSNGKALDGGVTFAPRLNRDYAWRAESTEGRPQPRNDSRTQEPFLRSKDLC